MEPTTPTTTVEPTTPEPEVAVDIDAASESISNDLFGKPDVEIKPDQPLVEPEPAKPTGPVATPPVAVAPTKPEPTPVPTPTTADEAPKTWPKEMHQHWATLNPAVKEYMRTREKQMLDGLEQYKGEAAIGRTFKDVLTPYLPHLKAAGIQPEQMVGNLLNAHWLLTRGTAESKAAYEKLGRDLGFVQADPNAPTPSPEIMSLRNELNEVKSSLTSRQQADCERAREEVTKEIDTFAGDTAAHPYFDEVADDIVALLSAYPKLSLQDAYDRAVYANPVTRAKELVRRDQDTEAKLRENARLDALPKKKAASSNVKSSETSKSALTEPLGTFDDTLRSTMRSIKERTH